MSVVTVSEEFAEQIVLEQKMALDIIGQTEDFIASGLGIDLDTASARLFSLASIRRQRTSDVALAVLNGTISLSLFSHPALVRYA